MSDSPASILYGSNGVEKGTADNPVRVDATGTTTQPVSLPPVSAAALTLVAASETSVTALAANANRKGAILLNHSRAMCYLKFGSNAGLEDFTLILGPYQGVQMECRYTGIVTAIWQKANGDLHVTELT